MAAEEVTGPGKDGGGEGGQRPFKDECRPTPCPCSSSPKGVFTEAIFVWGRQNKNLKGLKKFKKETRVTNSLAEGLNCFLCVCVCNAGN